EAAAHTLNLEIRCGLDGTRPGWGVDVRGKVGETHQDWPPKPKTLQRKEEKTGH
ncbi:hypothetical protein P7K49_006039, partial [Saguinus oedipus]